MSLLRITVVDDNVDLLESLVDVLAHLGHEARGVNNGRDALRAMDEQPPDVALVDVGMPVMTGYDVAAAVRGRPWGSAVTLVALTGWGGSEDRARALAAGFDQLVVKPVDLERLRELLASLAAARSRPGAITPVAAAPTPR